MGLYLNRDYAFERFVKNTIFVDKTLLIDVTNRNLDIESTKFMCVTHPRRFGKTMAILMLNDYYSKGANTKYLFDELKISKSKSYLKHLNNHNVIFIDVGGLYCKYTFDKKIFNYLEKQIINSLKEEFSNINFENCSLENAIIKVNKLVNQKFIFLLDEWDCILRDAPNTELEDIFLSFFSKLLNNKNVCSSIELFYMTGILPTIYYEKFTNLITLFKDYSILYSRETDQFIGYTENEVIDLCDKYDFNFDLIKKWYKGYNVNELTIYNPICVNETIEWKKCLDYWNQTCSVKSLSIPLSFNKGELKEETALLIAGYSIPLEIPKNLKDLVNKNTKISTLIKLIHLGYLTYDFKNKECRITNYEITKNFVHAVIDLKWKEISTPTYNSRELYELTLKGKINFINESLDENYNSLISISNNIKENIFKIFIQLSYFYAYEYYEIKFNKLNKSNVNAEFIPLDNKHIPMIIDLKINASIDTIINQIKEKNYSSVFTGYKGKVLLLGISYNSKTLKHTSKIEYIEL